MGLTKEIELIGRNPEMSWSLNDLQEETTIRFAERGTITVPFYTFGYDGMYKTGADGVFHEKEPSFTCSAVFAASTRITIHVSQ